MLKYLKLFLILFLFDDTSYASIDRKYLPVFDPKTSDFRYPEFESEADNAISTYLQALSSRDDDLLQKLYAHGEKKLDIVESNLLLKKIHIHTRNYLFLKERLTKGLTDLEANHSLTKQILYGFKTSLFAAPTTQLLDPARYWTKTTWNQQWKLLPKENQLQFLTKAQENIYLQALSNAQESYAQILTNLTERFSPETWRQTNLRHLQEVFCSKLNLKKSRALLKENISSMKPNRAKLKCENIASKTINRVRKPTSLEESMKHIAHGLNLLNGALFKIDEYKKHSTIDEDTWVYQDYVLKYTLLLSGPGIAVTQSPLKEYVGRFWLPKDLNDPDVWHAFINYLGLSQKQPYLYPYLNVALSEPGSKGFLDFKENTKMALLNAASQVAQNIRELTEDYDQAIVDEYDYIYLKLSEISLDAGIAIRLNHIKKQIRHQPLAVGQAWYQDHAYTFVLHQQLKQAIFDIGLEKARHQSTNGAIVLVGIVLMITGIGTILGFSLVSMGTSASALFCLGFISTVMEIGQSEYHLAEKQACYDFHVKNLLSRNAENITEIGHAFSDYKDAIIARRWARGGALFQIPEIALAGKLIARGVKPVEAFAQAMGLADQTIATLPSKINTLPKKPTGPRLEEIPHTFQGTYPELFTSAHDIEKIRRYFFNDIDREGQRLINSLIVEVEARGGNSNELLTLMYNIHTRNNSPDLKSQKIRELALLRNYLDELGIDRIKNRKITKLLADKGILGEDSESLIAFTADDLETLKLEHEAEILKTGYFSFVSLTDQERKAYTRWTTFQPKKKKNLTAEELRAEVINDQLKHYELLKDSKNPVFKVIAQKLRYIYYLQKDWDHIRVLFNEVAEFNKNLFPNKWDDIFHMAVKHLGTKEISNLEYASFSIAIRAGQLENIKSDLITAIQSKTPRTSILKTFRKYLNIEDVKVKTYEKQSIELAKLSLSRAEVLLTYELNLQHMMNKLDDLDKYKTFKHDLLNEFHDEDLHLLHKELSYPLIVYHDGVYKIGLQNTENYFNKLTEIFTSQNIDFAEATKYLIQKAKTSEFIDDTLSRILQRLEDRYITIKPSDTVIELKQTLLTKAKSQRSYDFLDGNKKQLWAQITEGLDGDEKLIVRQLISEWDDSLDTTGFIKALNSSDSWLSQRYVLKILVLTSKEPNVPLAKKSLCEQLIARTKKIKEPKPEALPKPPNNTSIKPKTTWKVLNEPRAHTTIKDLPPDAKSAYLNEFLPELMRGKIIDDAFCIQWHVKHYTGQKFLYARLNSVWRVHFKYNGRNNTVTILEFENHH